MVNFTNLTPGQRKFGFFLAIKKQEGLLAAIAWAWRNRKNRY